MARGGGAAHADRILDGARSRQVSRAREEPRAAHARREPGGRRRHHYVAHQAHPPQVHRGRPGVRCHRHRLRHGLSLARMKWPRFSLRVKLALVLVTLLALPAAGILYVNEAERFLLQGQEQSLLAVARAGPPALHEGPQLLARASGSDDEVDAILLGLQRASSRIWLVDARSQVIAAAGSLRRPTEVA